MNIYEINVSNEYRKIVDHIKKGLQDIFSHSHASEGDIYVVNHFPAATDGFGETELLIFINIPNEEGNYYWHINEGKKYYLNNLVIGIKMLYDDSITDVDSTTLYSSEGYLDYIEELEREDYYLKKFSSFCVQPLKNSIYFYWIVSSGSKKSFSNNYIIFNSNLDISRLLYSACQRARTIKLGISSFSKVENLGQIVLNYIEVANKRTEIGILTKKRIDKITEKKVSTPLRALNNQGKAITILQGKAGCGKTLMLTRIFNKIVASGHHCRFLTYNHLLVFDLKHCLCRMPVFRNTNAYIHTLHFFFYHLSRKMGIQSLFTEKRFNELMDVCIQRLDIADRYIKLFKEETDKWPSNEAFWNKFKDDIDSGDRVEITKYLKYLDINMYSTESIIVLREFYIIERKQLLLNELGNELFLADYNKILENMYLMLDNPREFYEKYNIKDRRELLNLMSKTDKKRDEDFTSEYKYEEFNKDVQNTIMYQKWSRSILIDEAQDCNNYEKLILMKIYGAENIVVTSGGKDQLIRTSLVTDWTRALEAPIPADIITLPGRSYRQKANVVKFVNAFGAFYNVASQTKSAEESKGLGRVIIDTRNSIRGFSKEILSQIREEGNVQGCSDYENCIILLPTTGYSSKTTDKEIAIDELDNVEIVDKTTNRKLEITSQELNIWNGIVDRKSKLSVPASNETRFIYYESCRGLEAWNVMCVDLDTFFYNMRSSKDAERYAGNAMEWYANNGQILFSDNDDLRNEFALHWIYMAITRPIDTLYIKLANPSNEFSQKILEIGNDCGAEIQCDSIVSNIMNEDLPF